MRVQLPTEVGISHLSGHSDRLLVTKGETRQRPPIACSHVTQAILFEMETVEDVQTAMVEDVEL